MDPLIGFALSHTKQASLHHLEGVGLQVSEQEEEPIFRRRQRAVFVHGTLAGGAGFPIEAPRRHVGLERGFKRRHQLLELLESYARQIQELCGAGLHIGEPYTSHGTCLLLQYRSVRGASYHKSG